MRILVTRYILLNILTFYFNIKFLKEIAKNSPTLLEETRSNDGCTPLLCAVKRNDLNAVVQLLAHGAKIHASDLSGNTPLHHAIMARSLPIVKLLLLFHADPNIRNNMGMPANSLKTRF